MRISIITATHNSAATIAGCIASVNEQTFTNIEHIIIDGDSKDSTLEIIQSTPGRVTRIFSEPDDGIYDALNKGIRQATGEIIGFLHADDEFFTPHTVRQIVNTFSGNAASEETLQQYSFKKEGKGKAQIHGIYGDLVFMSRQNAKKVVRTWKSKPFQHKNIVYGWAPPHPTLFLRKEVYQKHGEFNTTFKIAGDYEFMLRVMKDPEIRLQYLPEVITKMRMGGASTGSLNGLIQKSKEDIRALRNNGFRSPLAVLAVKNIRKLPQLFKK
jgi:glycosyltransferase